MNNPDELKTQMVAAIQQTRTMKEASEFCGMPFSTFKHRAIKFDIYKPDARNQRRPSTKINIVDIIVEGKHPHYQSNKLRKRLIKEGYKEHRCEKCNLREWNGQPITLELDHVDGDCRNHLLDNLRILCPNCHSQTGNWRGKNMGRYD